ncbi:MAG: hypothetical protein AB8H03_17965 [Saprospiraceae bacterium]
MKTKFLFFFFLTIPILLSAQKDKEYKKYIKYYYKNIYWGDRQYDNSIRGVDLLLEDIKKIDTELYSILNEEYEIYNNKKDQANITTGVGIGLGVSFMVLAANDFELFNNNNNNSGAYLVSALLITTGSLLIGKSMRPNERKFIFRFTNIFNENTNGEKVIYSIRPAIDLGNYSSLGLSFSLKF